MTAHETGQLTFHSQLNDRCAVNMMIVGKMMSHSDTKTTMIYAKAGDISKRHVIENLKIYLRMVPK